MHEVLNRELTLGGTSNIACLVDMRQRAYKKFSLRSFAKAPLDNLSSKSELYYILTSSAIPRSNQLQNARTSELPIQHRITTPLTTAKHVRNPLERILAPSLDPLLLRALTPTIAHIQLPELTLHGCRLFNLA